MARPTNVAHVLMSLDGEAFMIRVPMASSNQEAIQTVRETYGGDKDSLVLLGVFWALPGELDWSVMDYPAYQL